MEREDRDDPGDRHRDAGRAEGGATRSAGDQADPEQQRDW
jgi:hypothetical protein